ncbi:MAG: methyltransferase [Clostridia bacterium]|nr:methyltransferase [Clostridia bacterium]
MKLEIERKYLIKNMPSLNNVSKIEYERYFISNDLDSQIRVQRKNDIYEIEKKIKLEKNQFKKEKTRISQDEFYQLIKGCKNKVIRDSYFISKNPDITIKIYHGAYEGLRRAEVEFHTMEEFEAFQKLDWFGKEITNDKIGSDAGLITLSREEFLSRILDENERIDDLEINSLKMIQNKEYFCFGMDSILLANFIESNSNHNMIMDFCSGSGVIPVIISAKKKYQKIVGVELQNEMFDLFVKNIAINHLSDKIMPIQSDIKEIQNIRRFLLEHFDRDNVDIIVCNPPYKSIGTGVQNENTIKYVARHEVYCKLEDIFSSASKLLRSKGKLYLVHKPDRLVDLLSIARNYRLEAKRIRFVHPKLDKSASIVLIEYLKDGGSEVNIQNPLIEYDINDEYTSEIYSIYGKKEKENG